jgi:hypothetical protein
VVHERDTGFGGRFLVRRLRRGTKKLAASDPKFLISLIAANEIHLYESDDRRGN